MIPVSPEVFSFADLRDRWPTGAENAPHLAVLGDPVAHSLSPPMHDAALAACGIPTRYARLHIRAEELAEALALLPERGFLGANLTIPHKTAALGLLDELDASARTLGAVNTVRVGPNDGRLTGLNTDGPGFARAVRERFGDVELSELRVMVLGAGGGAGRALAAQCHAEGCRGLFLVNRTGEKARALAAELPGAVAVPWEEDKGAALAAALRETDLLVNASTVGLHAGDPCPVPAKNLRPGLRVFDTVYRRDGQPTALVAAARAAGVEEVADGLALLLHQGALAFEIWFGRPAPLEVMRAALTQAASPTPRR